MNNSSRPFFKQGLAGALALGSASLPVSAAAMTDGVGKVKAKCVVLISLDEMIVPWGITGPGIRKGFKITEPNNTVNTAATILRLFDVEKPLPWTGEVLSSIFK